MAVVPLQDLLSLGTDARMNLPGCASGNWGWRFLPEQIDEMLSEWLHEITTLYGRGSAVYVRKDKKVGGQLEQVTKTLGISVHANALGFQMQLPENGGELTNPKLA
jgi:4-alpha-glucanotransferase